MGGKGDHFARISKDYFIVVMADLADLQLTFDANASFSDAGCMIQAEIRNLSSVQVLGRQCCRPIYICSAYS